MTAAPVSVVIATRDRPQLVREAIDSVLVQDYAGPVEVVVVFDQSAPDLSLISTDRWRAVRVVANARKPGLAGARNTGIEASRGDYVAFCDDDDYWLPSKVRRQVEALHRLPDAGLATCGIRVEYDGQRFDRVLEMDDVPFEELLSDRHTELHPSTFLLRKSIVDSRIGLVDEDVPGGFGEDYELLLRAAKVHPVVNVREPLAVVRWGKQSFFFRRWETMAAGLTWLLQRYPEFEQSARGVARVRGQVAFAQASMGNRLEAFRWAVRAVRRNPAEPRAYLAAAVASGALKPDPVMERLHRSGRGI